MNPFIAFMASSAGRIVRIVAGLALIALGLLVLGGTFGIIVAVVGALPLVAGIFDFCVFAPLFGAPLSGPKIRGRAVVRTQLRRLGFWAAATHAPPPRSLADRQIHLFAVYAQIEIEPQRGCTHEGEVDGIAFAQVHRSRTQDRTEIPL